MVRRVLALFGPLLVLTSGCFSDDKTQLVPAGPLTAPPATMSTTRSAYPPAPTEVGCRVDRIGRQLVAANPQLGMRPMFRTIGAPQTEIFHRGTAEVYISEALVRQCSTDNALAALLCMELGKMVAEREALTSPRVWQMNQEPPPDVPVGNDSGSYSGPSDQTHLAELAKYRPPAHRGTPPPPPDPESLARIYLQKAGYPAAELDAAAPLLKAAAQSSSLEKSVVNPAPTAPLVK